MAKIDYSKSERLLSDALLKMSVKQLLILADRPESFNNPADPNSLPSLQARVILLEFMDRDLESINKVEGPHKEKLGLSRPTLKRIIDKAPEITLEDWIKLKKIRQRVLKYKKDLWEKIPHLSDDQIVDLERKKTKNKRFNVRDKWLPLH
jgi:hypothetical protein